MSVMESLKDELRENAISFSEDEGGSLVVNDGEYDRPPHGAYTDEALANLIRRPGVTVVFLRGGGLQVFSTPRPRRFDFDGNYLPLDPTCAFCEFGEYPHEH